MCLLFYIMKRYYFPLSICEPVQRIRQHSQPLLPDVTLTIKIQLIGKIWNCEPRIIREFFSIEPGGRFRYGSGEEAAGREFDAYLWEAYLRLGYKNPKRFDGYVRFSTVQVETGDDAVPYQMMSGYSDGTTFRLETSLSFTVNQNISFGLYYILRFGDAEENIFQKLSTEARAVF